MTSHQWKLKNNDEVCSLRLSNSTETVLLLSVIADGKDGDRLHVEKFSLRVLVPILSQNQKCTIYSSSCQKMIDVLNFKAMFSARVKVRKQDFCVVLARQEKKTLVS